MRTTTAAEAETIQLVVFTLGDEQYALPIERVQEIIRWTEPRSITSEDPSVRGVISLRGKIIPVCDLTSRLGCRTSGEDHEGNIIVVDSDERPVGVIVDEVDEVRTIDRGQVEPSPTETGQLIDGIAKLDDRLVVLLDPDATAQS